MSLNKVMLIGNVGKEPDVRYLDNGVAVASVVMATSERGYRLQNGTEVPERTEWHNVVLWRGLAETVENTCIRATNCSSKVKSGHVRTMTRMVRSVTSRRFSPTIWKCSLRAATAHKIPHRPRHRHGLPNSNNLSAIKKTCRFKV